jgi:PKD repeat protein
MSECTACHTNSPSTITGGPHGMHPVGSAWVSSHHNALESGQATRTQCQPCHGIDYRGTVLSRMQADRTLSAFGAKNLFRGAIIGCYTCHNGPGNDNSNTNAAPVVAGIVTNTTNDKSVDILLPITGTGAYPRIISQAANGSVGLNTNTHVATYFPNPGFVGHDQFTFAAYDGSKNSALATGMVTVAQGPFSIGAVAHVPPTYPGGWPVAFTVVPTVTNSASVVTFDWDFGDGSAHSTNQYAAHAYTAPGSYNWSVTSTVSTASTTANGSIVISGPVQLSLGLAGNQVTLSWPSTIADTILESSSTLGPSAQWQAVTNSAGVIQPATANQFYRIRRPW